jgi:hypothetical protein
MPSLLLMKMPPVKTRASPAAQTRDQPAGRLPPPSSGK